MGIEKAFDSVDHYFLVSTLEKNNFGKNFIFWIQILLRDQEFCVSNGGIPLNYLTWEKAPSRRPNFNFFILSVLALEILFFLIKLKPDIEGLATFYFNYLYFTSADDTTLFLKDIISIKQLIETYFSHFSGLKPSFKKSEIEGIGVLKGVQVEVKWYTMYKSK